MKKSMLVLLACIFCIPAMMSQGITTHQYRRVEPENMQEYLKRETTYWQKLAESEVTKGNLTFWAILQRVGGINQDKSSNILIINTFNNMDTANEIWGNVQDLFPDTKMEDINTWNLGKNTSTVFLHGLGNHIEVPNVDRDKDFNYVYIIYHNPKDRGKFLKFEEEKWKPMAKKAMDEGKTTMKGWGNSMILHPESGKFPYSTASYDLFSSLTDALGPGFSEDFTWPEDFFEDNMDNVAGPRHKELYRIVTAVSQPKKEE